VEDERRRPVQGLDAEGVLSGLMKVVEVEKEHGKQHQHGADQGIEEEFDGRVELTGAAPDADQAGTWEPAWLPRIRRTGRNPAP